MKTYKHFKNPLTAFLVLLLFIPNGFLQAQKNNTTSPVTEQQAKAVQYFMSGVASADALENNIPKSQSVQTCGTQVVYRNIDGQCNNINTAEWGAAHIPLFRELPSAYGTNDPLNSIGGLNRPNPRSISNLIFQQDSTVFPSTTLSSFVFSWGQFLDHDIGISPEAETETATIFPTGEPGDLITVPITFHRSEVFPGTGVTTPRAQENIVTAWIDGSQVYGSETIRATWLRQGTEGKMRTSAGNFLPYNTIDGEPGSPTDPNAPAMATAGLVDRYFVAGDIRANEQSSLTALHTLFVREHNRICDEIILNNSNLNPIWDDETIYKMARKRVIALLQRITYNEFLPTLGVNLNTYNGYNNSIQPDIINGFSTAAYRLGHTMVTNELLLLDDDNNPVGQGKVSLIQAFFNPGIIAMNDIDPILNGLAAQFQEEIDANLVEELRTFLFAGGPGPGLDLAALNIQRGRDHGLADYNAYRNHFTGSLATNMADITSDPLLQNQLNALYPDINDIDAWVGFLSEDKLPGSQLGATLTAMLAEQFGRLRDGDYYYYLNDPALVNDISTIENTLLSDVIKRNTNILTLQDNVFNAECDVVAGNCCRLNDSLSLVALYDATNGASWTNSWDLDQPMTTWYGVTLNGNGCVKTLNLSNNNLIGWFPVEIGDLQSLTYLNLSYNVIDGNIPPSIGNLSTLGFLDLRNNLLDGNIPVTLANLSILTFLHLENNLLTGEIPPILANMSSLAFLYVSNNNLSGCYDPTLAAFCTRLNPVSNTNANISDDNNFDISWESFCSGSVNCGNTTGSGADVWPGDMDNDGDVDEDDPLFWGIGFLQTGPARPNATTNWIAQPAQNWQFDANMINNKHQDADGNGVVDGADLQVVDLNFGQTTGAPTLASFIPNTLNYFLEPLPPASGNIRYALHVTDFDGAAVMAHGLACTIDFSDIPISTVSVDVTGSSLVPNEVFDLYNADQNRLALALTRTDGVDVLCDGAVATITIATDNAPTGESFNFNINKGNKIVINGDLDGIADMTFYDNYIGFGPASNNLVITASVMHEQCNMLGKASVQAYGGSAPYYAYMWSTGANTATVENLPSGTYSVTVTDAGGLTESLTVQINGQEPIYDNNGNMICASSCPDFVAPTGSIANDACQAGISVTSDGTVPTGGDVQFQAGEVIILNPGFSVEPNADFSADIEDCGGIE